LGGFWSLTVYNEEHLIEPNQLIRELLARIRAIPSEES